MQESSREISARVKTARDIQHRRYAGEGIFTNSQMQPMHIRRYCRTGVEEEHFLRRLVENFGLSARGYARILKVARTIADMSGAEDIKTEHISEAVQYRFQENV